MVQRSFDSYLVLVSDLTHKGEWCHHSWQRSVQKYMTLFWLIPGYLDRYFALKLQVWTLKKLFSLTISLVIN
jgi:hypothetical protein